MPSVELLPGLVVQQKTESLPHFAQTCLTSSFAPLPIPTTVIVTLTAGAKVLLAHRHNFNVPFFRGDIVNHDRLALGADHGDGVARFEVLRLNSGVYMV